MNFHSTHNRVPSSKNISVMCNVFQLSPIRNLNGGEQNRLHRLKMFIVWFISPVMATQ